MRFAMDPLGGGRIRRVYQAEAGAAPVIEPVRHVSDVVFVLDFEVFAVRFGNALGGHITHVVAIHEDRHSGPPGPPTDASQGVGQIF
jgi:hypothetical protein